MKFVYCVLTKTFDLSDNLNFTCSTCVSGAYSTLEGARHLQEVLVKGESFEIFDDDFREFPEYRVQVSSSRVVYYVIDKVPFDL